LREIVDEARGRVCESEHLDLQASCIELKGRMGYRLLCRFELREVGLLDVEVA